MISDTISDIIGDMISDIVPDKDKGEAAVTGSVFRFYSGLTTDCVYFFEATSEHLNIFAFVKRIEYDFVPGHRLNPPVSPIPFRRFAVLKKH